MGSDLVSRILTGNEFQTLGAENRKARDPKVKLWQGTESWWELDERRDLVGSWYCKRSERYGGATSMQSFEGQSGQFKPYSPFNRKPVELIEKFGWRQWRWMRLPVQSNPNRCIRWRLAVCFSYYCLLLLGAEYVFKTCFCCCILHLPTTPVLIAYYVTSRCSKIYIMITAFAVCTNAVLHVFKQTADYYKSDHSCLCFFDVQNAFDSKLISRPWEDDV